MSFTLFISDSNNEENHTKYMNVLHHLKSTSQKHALPVTFDHKTSPSFTCFSRK